MDQTTQELLLMENEDGPLPYRIYLSQAEIDYLDSMASEGKYESTSRLIHSLLREIIRDDKADHDPSTASGGGGCMKVYLAARYSRIAEMRTYRAQLERVGYVVTSRWVDGHDLETDSALSIQLAGFAQKDCDDVKAADCVISFTEAPRGGHSRGGRHVEHGMALAWNKRVIVIGHRENVFHSLPQVEFFETWRDAYCHLTKQPVAAA